MERLTLKYQQLLQAYETLVEVFDEAKKSENLTPMQSKIHRDSMIKRFEYCYELTWKYLKLYLKEIHGIDAASPKKVFLECASQEMTNEKQTEQLLFMADSRNNTSHMYNENIAEKIGAKVPDYYNLMVEVTKKLAM